MFVNLVFVSGRINAKEKMSLGVFKKIIKERADWNVKKSLE